MNLLIFTNSLAGGGAERVVATLANHWARRLWTVTVVTLAPASDDFYALDPRVNRIALDLSLPSRGAVDALLQNLRRIVALRRAITQAQPTVAVSMMSTPNVLLAFASRGITGLCSIGSERCYPPHFPLGRVWSGLRRIMYGRLSAVVALTKEGAQWIGSHSSAKCVTVIPNAASWPLSQHFPRIDPGLLRPAGRKILLAVGRLDTVKNFSLLIRVFAQLAGRHPAWDLVILGEGPERAVLEKEVQDLTGDGRVHLPGIAGNVGEWYARADLYVMSSRSEGFPNSLAEAMAHGLPAVSFDCNTGPRDIIRHGTDGLLVPPDDPAALMASLDRLMGDRELRAGFASRARDARERFSLERVAGMWEDLFRELAPTRLLSPTDKQLASRNGRWQ